MDQILDHFYVSGIFLLSLVVMGNMTNRCFLLMRAVMDGAKTPAAIFSILGPRPSMPVAFVGFCPRMNSITC